MLLIKGAILSDEQWRCIDRLANREPYDAKVIGVEGMSPCWLLIRRAGGQIQSLNPAGVYNRRSSGSRFAHTKPRKVKNG